MATRLPVATKVGHTNRALCFVEQSSVWIGIGRTSPWSGESAADFVPPLPSIEATSLDELIGMAKVYTKTCVVPDASGTIVYRDSTWRTVSQANAIAQKAHWVYIEASINFDDLPATAYRQIGVFSRVVPKSGYEQATILLPSQIQSTGILEILDQRKVVTRNEDSRDVFSMIIEF